MKKTHTLRKSLITSHILVSLIPLCFIALFILLFIVRNAKEDFMVRIDMLSKGIRGQIELFMDQPLTSLNTIASMLYDLKTASEDNISRILNSHIRESLIFESIYLLNPAGEVINAGLPEEREQYRPDLIGIHLGHKKEFQAVRVTGRSQWSDTFLSLVSGKISLTLYVPTGKNVLAADINLTTLAQFIYRLSSDTVVTMVIDSNGAIIFHPNPDLVGKSIMLNDIELVTAALAGKEEVGHFTLQGKSFLGSTSIIEHTGWVSLIAEPAEKFSSFLIVPLLIFGSGICAAVGLSLVLAVLRAQKLSRPLTEITAKSSIIAQGDYTNPVPPNSFSELQQLADSINQMAAAIQKREAELRDKELNYRELVENTSNLVLRLDRNFIISYANHTIHRLTGIPIANAIGKPFQMCIAADDWQFLEKSIRSWVDDRVESNDVECRIRHKNGKSSHLLLSFNLHYNDEGSLTDLNIIGHDITVRYEIEQQQKELEMKRQQSHKMELLGLMAGGVAHDLNNILAGIINYPELLLLDLDKDNPLRGPLMAIQKSGERAAAVVADLLTIARGSAAVHETTDLNHLANNYFTTPEFQKLRDLHPDIGLTFTPCPDLWSCNCSPIHIEKTIMNLVMNAFEAIKTHGRVEVTTANITPEELADTAADQPPGQYVAMTVRDTGKGISQADQKRIFEPFFSKKGLGRSGTGLGLTVAWNSVREHGGAIIVKSNSSGTQFTVLLPALSEAPVSQKQPEEAAHLRGNGEHILVVDDEESLREIACNMLKLLDYKTSSVKSGEEALTFLRATPVDLVLLDMQMDPGMNGRETYSRIKKDNPLQKALIATGYSTSKDVEDTLREGAGAFIKKPYNLLSLGHAVHKVLQHDI